MSVQYQVRLEDNSYALVAMLDTWIELVYTQRLNDVGYAELSLRSNDAKISDITPAKRLKIIRNGEIVFGGIIQRINWSVPQAAPEGETYKVYAQDHAIYAARRIIVPPSGAEHDERTDHLDDILKAWVYYHAGAGAIAARQFSDLSVEADKHAGTSMTLRARYQNLLSTLQKYAVGAIDWRFVPLDAGTQFRTALLWGIDRTQGNGVNAECVFSADRHNFLEVDYTSDIIELVNYVYVGGQGEGTARNIVERSDTASIAAYGRREAFVDARHLSLTSSLQAYGDAALQEKAAIEAMSVKPIAETWKASSGTTWDLGDKVTVLARRWREFSYNGKIVAVEVRVDRDGIETITPSLEKC